MNKEKWIAGDFADETWMMKLGEEFGEVMNARRKVMKEETDPSGAPLAANIELIKELLHLEFISYEYRRRLTKRIVSAGEATVK